MSAFDWSTAADTLQDFGGEPTTLHIPKTGLPFFDTIRLYGAIDLYIGLREDVYIHDEGATWRVNSLTRKNLIEGKKETAVTLLKEKAISKRDWKWLKDLDDALENKSRWPITPMRNLKSPLRNPDSALRDGVRNQAASKYSGLETGYGIKSKIPWSDALLAFAGQKRVENVSRMYFLPVFEGRIDLSKVVSPLRVWIRDSTNVLCTQALMLLALKTSLFAEGYQDRLTAVVYNTYFNPQKEFNFSGIIKIGSTAIGKMKSAELVSHTYQTFRELIRDAWDGQGKPNKLTSAAIGMAYWLMQPVSKHLSSMITAQERLYKDKGAKSTLFYIQNKNHINHVKEIFEMTYGNWNGDHEAVRKLARAVASGISWARGRDEHGKWLEDKEQRKKWYNEVTMLRSAPSARTFKERAMILIEQGHREHGQIGTVHRDEDFDPKALLDSIGTNRSEFEKFRDLFRMYLVQESTYKKVDSETTTDTISKHKED